MVNLQDAVHELEQLALQDKTEEVTTRLRSLNSQEIQDSGFHLRLADLCESIGLGNRLVVELNYAFRDAPDDLDILRRIAHVHDDAGRTERAIKCWRALLERCPDDVEAWEELVDCLQATSQQEAARAALEEAVRRTGNKRFGARLRLPPQEEPAAQEEASSPLPSDPLLARFVSLFSGREGVYARQWANAQGETGYTPIREPFTISVARNHLMGNHTVGIYPIRVDNTVSFAALDLDLPKSLVSRSAPGRRDWEAAMDRLHGHAQHLQQEAERRGLKAYVEDSGGKGRHVWIFFSQPLPARSARRLAQQLYRAGGSLPRDVCIEIFPKQGELPPDGLGNLIKLPLGLHRLTGRRGCFLENRQELPDNFILAIIRNDRDTVAAFLDQTEAPENDPSEPDEIPATTQRASATTELPYAIEDDAETQLMLARCATLRALVDRAEACAQLSYDEAMVVVHTVGHLEHGPSAVNTLLRRCVNVDPSLHLKSRLRGNPMSCPKIRSRIPGVTSSVACNCEFQLGAGLYPTPLLHVESPSALPPGAMDSLQFQALLKDYLTAAQGLHDAQRRCETYSKRLGTWFDHAGIDEFRTPLGVLKRIRGEDGTVTFTLEV
ncbi:MAG: CRISPR-associated primase-polymerase type A1 [Candidatus Xenobia bacterium]